MKAQSFAASSTRGTVTVTVNRVDDLTVASPTITVAENGVASGNVLSGASDSEGDPNPGELGHLDRNIETGLFGLARGG